MKERLSTKGNRSGERVWLHRVLAASAFGGTLALALLGNKYVRPAVDDLLHEPTPQEAAIAAVLNEVADQVANKGGRIKVRCIAGLTEEEGLRGSAHGFRGFILPLLRMDQKICDTLSDIMNGVNPTTYDATVAENMAIQTAAHELGHYLFQLGSEGEIVCAATQISGLMAEGFGMNDRRANAVAVAIMVYEYDHPKYKSPEDCVPGSKYDLGIPPLPGAGYGVEGYFPVHRADRG